MLWPKFEDEATGYKLAAAGSIGANAFEFTDLGFWLAEKLLTEQPETLVKRYELDLTTSHTAEDIINQVAAKRGGLMAAGRVNFHRASEVLIQDFRNGSLGQLSLEKPSDFINKI